jgi:tRNA (guanosine-2'-O-)-methyltransferase
MKISQDSSELQELLKWKIPRSGRIAVAGESYEPDWIVERMSPLLTVERLATLEKVVQRRTWSVATICDGLFDVGNISAVMRSSESFGFVEFHLLERAEAAYKKSDRISRGSEKWLDIHRTQNVTELLLQQRRVGRKIIATTLDDAKSIESIDLSVPLCLVFGNEKDGVRKDVLDQADERVKLPMHGFTESFNISVAAALCYQRVSLARDKHSTDLSETEKRCMLATYILRSLGEYEKVAAILKAEKARV